MTQLPSAPRFRLVIDLTFDEADPWSPSEYDRMVDRFKHGVETMSACACSQVVVREYLTIGSGEDYSHWRYHRGSYGLSEGEPAITITPMVGPIPAVAPEDLRALWSVIVGPDDHRAPGPSTPRTVST